MYGIFHLLFWLYAAENKRVVVSTALCECYFDKGNYVLGQKPGGKRSFVITLASA